MAGHAGGGSIQTGVGPGGKAAGGGGWFNTKFIFLESSETCEKKIIKIGKK